MKGKTTRVLMFTEAPGNLPANVQIPAGTHCDVPDDVGAAMVSAGELEELVEEIETEVVDEVVEGIGADGKPATVTIKKTVEVGRKTVPKKKSRN